MMNHYGVLGVGPEASDEALRTAYRRRARETHPDHGGTRSRFAEVRAAWDVLRQPSQRAAYDRELRAFLGSIGAVLCPACGAANRVPPEAACGCDLCNADLPKRPRTARDSVEQVTGRIRARALALGDQAGERLSEVGDRLVGGLGDLLLDGVDRGLQSLRRRLGLDRDGRGR